jgi:transcriptional regulator with XRE-family HTH domain
MVHTTGGLLRSARLQAGFTRRALANRLGVSHSFIRYVEADTKRLPVARWHQFAALLPTLTIEALAQAHVGAGHVELDAADLSAEHRAQLETMLTAVAVAKRAA